MPRLRSSVTGVVVNVSDEKAARLVGFAPVEAEKPKPAAAKKAATAKKSN